MRCGERNCGVIQTQQPKREGTIVCSLIREKNQKQKQAK